MKLVIAEKPSVARELARVLGVTNKKENYLEGNGYAVTWAVGHLVKLADPDAYGWEKWSLQDLPMLPEPFKLETIKNVSSQFKTVKELFSACDEIIVATDAGREGELIFRYIYQLSGCKKPFKRLWVSSLTDEAIKQGFNNLKQGNLYDNLFFAAKGRSECDWLVGMNATRALTLSANTGGVLSLGRVQTPVLAMICSRFLENTNFKPEAFYELSITLDKGERKLKANYLKTFKDKSEAEDIKAKLGKSATCTKAEKKEKSEAAPLLYDLTSLQQDGNKKFGFSAQKTLDLAQDLYEKYKVLTYPRTGSRYLSDDMKTEVPKLWKMLAKTSKYSAHCESLASNPLSKRPFDNDKVTDHHALLPTEVDGKNVELPDDHRKLYDAVVTRFLAAFSENCIKEVTSLEFDCSGYVFKASGTVIQKEGWRKVESEPEKEEDKEEDENQTLPKVDMGDVLTKSADSVKEKFTKPKAIHTESSLLKLMETAGKELEDDSLTEAIKDSGLGTPATRAATIETLFDRNYIERKKKSLVPTDLGLSVYNLVKDKQIASVEMTAKWEKQLNDISLGKAQLASLMLGVKDYAKLIVSELVESGKNMEIETYPCPKCQANLKPAGSKLECVKVGCGFVLWKKCFQKDLSESDIKALLTGKETRLIKGFISSSQKKFDAKLKLEDFKIKPIFEGASTAAPSTDIGERKKVVLGELNGKEVVAGVGQYGTYILFDGKYTNVKGKEVSEVTLELAKEFLSAPVSPKQDALATFGKYKVVHTQKGIRITDGEIFCQLPRGVVDYNTLDEKACKGAIDSLKDWIKKNKK
jgi:DNA topoisomerase-3